MAEANLTTVSAMLRTVYKDAVTKTFTGNKPLLKALPMKSDPTVEGEQITFPLHIAGSGGLYVGDSDQLPEAQYQRWSRGYWNFKNHFAKVKFSGRAVAATARKEGGEEDLMAFEMKNIIEDQRYLRQRFGWIGESGVMATCPASAGQSATVLRCATTTVTGGTQTASVVQDLRLLRKGDVVDVLITATGAVGGGGRNLLIDDVAEDTNRDLTFDSSTPLANFSLIDSTYSVYWAGSRNQGTWGLPDIIRTSNPASGNYYGEINRTGNSWWKGKSVSCRVGGADQPLTFDKIADGFNKVKKLADPEPGKWLCLTDHETISYIINTAINDRRYGGQQKTFEIWGDGVEFMGQAIVPDQHCQPFTMWLLTPEYWHYVVDPVVGVGQWIGEESPGQPLIKQVPNRDAFEATWKTYGQVVCLHPAAQCKIVDFTL